MKRTVALPIIVTVSLTIIISSWLVYDKSASDLVTIKDSHLYIGEKQFTFLGANSFELWQYSLANITQILDVAHEQGIRVTRVFLGGTAFEEPLGTYNEWNLKKLDYVLAYSRLKGMYVIVTLRDNNWIEDVYWNETGTVNKMKMYTDPKMIEAYKKFIDVVLNRVNAYNYRTYRNDPTILAWDLCNEPDITVRDSSLEAYVKEVSNHIKSIDSKHLITVGLCYKPNVELVEDFVDFNSVHSYPDEEGQIEDITYSSNKPAILGEFGVHKTWFPDDVEATIYEAYLDKASANNMSGVMFWNLGLGHNLWDRWIGSDSHLFNTFTNGQWTLETYQPSLVDYFFFNIGSSVQLLSSHGGVVALGLLVIAAVAGTAILLSWRLRKNDEIPKKFSA